MDQFIDEPRSRKYIGNVSLVKEFNMMISYDLIICCTCDSYLFQLSIDMLKSINFKFLAIKPSSTTTGSLGIVLVFG